MPTALITGATAGIGAAFVDALAARGYDLVLVARDGDRLRRQAPAGAEVLAADLASDAGCALVEARCAQGLDLLVNNAGMGMRSAFEHATAEQEEQLLRLNVRAVLRLTHAALAPMLARGSGAILNVSSVAGFSPGVRGATYSASKAWVTNFSESLDLQYRDRGVRCVAVCPGFTHTEFHARADIDMSKLPAKLWLTSEQVVAEAFKDLDRGRSVSIAGLQYKAIVAATRVLPPSLRRRASRIARSTLKSH
ncbi:MAG: short-chain dehydrogenase/reductase [Frankiales bacterium]|nr:short-chain dehydrogenase/reductase [Frankiales bacterium]